MDALGSGGRDLDDRGNLEWEVVVPQRLGIYAIWIDVHGDGCPKAQPSARSHHPLADRTAAGE